MDRCPALIGEDMPRVCRSPLMFYGVSSGKTEWTSWLWARWTYCDACGAYTATNEKGGIIMTTGALPTNMEFGNVRIERSDVDSERPDTVRSLPKVQPKRVGGPIGRYLVQSIHKA